MIPPKCCFTKKGINKWAHISETPPNQLDYLWFSKCPLNLGLEKPILINSADMSHLPPFSHWSILGQGFCKKYNQNKTIFQISIYFDVTKWQNQYTWWEIFGPWRAQTLRNFCQNDVISPSKLLAHLLNFIFTILRRSVPILMLWS